MNDRNSRQAFLGPDIDGLLAETQVTIVGNCGGGSHIAQQLAHIGIGKFTLIDPDITEAPNLNRMIGSSPDDAVAARLKTDVLRRLILSINPKAGIQCFASTWQECAVELRNSDIVFGCVDGFITRNDLEAYCRRFLLPYIDIGMDVTKLEEGYVVSGQVITSLPGRPCMRCMGFLKEELLAQEAAKYGAAGPRPQVVWPNGVLASLAVGNSIRLLAPWSPESVCPYLVYDGNRQLVTPSTRLAHIDLGSCRHYPSDQVGDPFWRR